MANTTLSPPGTEFLAYGIPNDLLGQCEGEVSTIEFSVSTVSTQSASVQWWTQQCFCMPKDCLYYKWQFTSSGV